MAETGRRCWQDTAAKPAEERRWADLWDLVQRLWRRGLVSAGRRLSG
ncbi:hypothetical protein ABZ260_00245 [Streptosporangium sp. NPDC006013]